MKGVIFESAGAAPKVVDDLPVPEPAEDQILVKSLYAAINPVDAYIANTGALLVDGFPIGLGVDGAGIVVTADTKHKKFAVGDHVCGCTRLGTRGHNTVAEFFLLDADVAIPQPKTISIQQAATVGVGAETACLALFDGLGIALPSTTTTTSGSDADGSPPGSKETSKGKDEDDEWLVVLGGASSVGKFAVQLGVAAGFKVAASCSAASADVVRDLDATVVFDYKAPLDEQVKTVVAAAAGSHGKLKKVFDAVGSNEVFARALFKELDKNSKDGDTDQKEAKADTDMESKTQSKGDDTQAQHIYRFATTNDFAPIAPIPHTTIHTVRLGPVGRPSAPDLNAKIASYIPVIVALMEQDKVAPSAYDVVGEGGFQDAIEAYTYQARGAGGANKVLVRIQDE